LFDCSLPSRRKGSRHTNKRNDVYEKMKQPHGILCLLQELLSLIGIRLQLQCGATSRDR
jgi:hypothetical protein